MALAVVRLAVGSFPVLWYARRTSCFSLGLGYAVPVLECCGISGYSISYTKEGLASYFLRKLGLGLAVRVFSSFGFYIIQLRKKEIVALAVVRECSVYFPVLECISYSTQ